MATQKAKRNRRHLGHGEGVPPEIIGWHALPPSGHTMTMSFDDPVMLTGVPMVYCGDADTSSIAAEQSGEQDIVITFGASVASGTEFSLGNSDPAIRTARGGYAQGQTYTLEGMAEEPGIANAGNQAQSTDAPRRKKR